MAKQGSVFVSSTSEDLKDHRLAARDAVLAVGLRPEMMEYFRLEGITYNMATLEESAATLSAAGFVDVEVRDRNAWYLELAARELASLEGPMRPLIVERIGKAKADHFIANWHQLVLVVRRGELRPGHLKAVKPRA